MQSGRQQLAGELALVSSWAGTPAIPLVTKFAPCAPHLWHRNSRGQSGIGIPAPVLRHLNGDVPLGPMTATLAPPNKPHVRGEGTAQRPRFRLALAATLRHIRYLIALARQPVA